LNGGIQPLLEGLLAALDASGMNESIGEVMIDPAVHLPAKYLDETPAHAPTVNFQFLVDMMSDNDVMAQEIADAINHSRAADDSLLRNFGISVRLRFALFGFIPIDAVAPGYIQGAYTGALVWPPPATPPN
jgi:hypothetical protein